MIPYEASWPYANAPICSRWITIRFPLLRFSGRPFRGQWMQIMLAIPVDFMTRGIACRIPPWP
jgi:hypothetical protein